MNRGTCSLVAAILMIATLDRRPYADQTGIPAMSRRKGDHGRTNLRLFGFGSDLGRV